MAQLTRISKTVSSLTADDVGALAKTGTAVNSLKFENLTKAQVIAEARVGFVPTSRTINGRPLTANITLNSGDIGSAPAVHSHPYVPLSEKGKPNGVASLDIGGKIPAAQMPPLSLRQSHTAQNESEMLALDAETGDICIRIDTNKTMVLARYPSTVASNWVSILSPTDSVQSINGRRGVVVLGAADVGAEAAFTKNGAFNKNFGTTPNTVAQGNDSRIVNAVPNIRQINGIPLTGNITLNHTHVGALAVGGTAVNSSKLDGKTKAQIIAEARAGLAATGISYTKAESDGRYLQKSLLKATLIDLIRTVDITLPAASNTVTVPADSVTVILFLSISGAVQNSEAYTLAGATITFAEQLTAGETVTIIGFK